MRFVKVTIMMVFFSLALVLLSAIPASAEEAEGMRLLGKTIGAALAVGLAGLGAGYAIGVAGAAVASGIVERREVVGPLLLVVVLGEGIAIYGLLVALLIIILV